jgi:hypothetical protein
MDAVFVAPAYSETRPATKINRVVMLFASLCFVVSLSAQTTGKKKPPKTLENIYVEPVYKKLPFKDTLDAPAFRRVTNQIYSSIATGQGQGVALANYGSFDPVAGNFKLNYFRIINPVGAGSKKDPGKSWYLNLSAGGNIIGNNTGVLFNNSKFNSGANLTGKVYIPLPGNSIMIDGRDAELAGQKKQELEYQRWLEKRKVWTTLNVGSVQDHIKATQVRIDQSDLESVQNRKDYAQCREDAKALEMLIDSLNRAGQVPTDPDYKAQVAWNAKLTDKLLQLSSRTDSLLKDSVILSIRMDSLQRMKSIIFADAGLMTRDSTEYSYSHYGIQLYQEINKRYDALLDTVELKAPYQPYTLKWIALLGMYNRSSYYLYNSALPFSQQISSNKLSVFNYGLEFNLIHSGSALPYYLNIGLTRLRNNNIRNAARPSISSWAPNSGILPKAPWTWAWDMYSPLRTARTIP